MFSTLLRRGPMILAITAALFVGCNEPAVTPPAAPDAGPAAAGLTAEQAARVVAKVGDRVLTLGDFAATLERMDQFDRLRYQTKERRRELLEEMINVELLAAEARRLGLDKQPETQDAVRQILRDAMVAKARKGLPAPGDIPAADVRAYYEANKDKFDEPERRRVAAIVFTDKKTAEKVLEDAGENHDTRCMGRALRETFDDGAQNKIASGTGRTGRRCRGRRSPRRCARQESESARTRPSGGVQNRKCRCRPRKSRRG